MSYLVIVRIGCDEPDCAVMVEAKRMNRGGLGKTHGGRLARSQGWQIAGGVGTPDPKRAYCPAHRKVAA